MGLAPGQSLMVTSTMGYPVIYKSISPLQCIMGVHCCCPYVNYIVYKHFDRSLHIKSLDPTYLKDFRPVPLTIFEILGFELKTENNKIFELAVGVCCCLQSM